jgi:hypothetical protein
LDPLVKNKRSRRIAKGDGLGLYLGSLTGIEMRSSGGWKWKAIDIGVEGIGAYARKRRIRHAKPH